MSFLAKNYNRKKSLLRGKGSYLYIQMEKNI